MNNNGLLENGFDYILNSLNELKTLEDKKGDKYIIKYIVRNLVSGIEIVLKYRLECSNWAFVIADLDKLSISDYNNGNFTSVTLEQSVDRLNKLCNRSISKKEQETFRSLKNIRNKIEHFKLILDEQETVILVYNCITAILKFIEQDDDNFKNKFNKEEEKLYSKIKEEILKLNNYLNNREYEIKTKYPCLEFKTCSNCHKECLKVDGTKCKCFLCNVVYQDTVYEREKYKELNNPDYRDISKGAAPIEEIECPYCGDIMLIDYDNNKAICYGCNKDIEITDVDCCEHCGRIGIVGICDNCLEEIAYMQWEISIGK